MAFVFSTDYNKEGFTQLDNSFIENYLAYSGEIPLKVYIYGLTLASRQGVDNSEETLCNALDLTPSEVLDAFRFWAEMGLVTIISQQPISVIYNSPRLAFSPNRKYNKDKYSDFNDNLQALFPTRMLERGELERYYDFIEDYHFDTQAMILIAKYCVDLKGYSVTYPYILTVARRWAEEGNITLEDVENKLKESESMGEDIREVYHTLKKTAKPDLEARQYYLKWTKTFGFSAEAILTAAKNIKKGGMEGLDSLLESYYRQGIIEADDIVAYKKKRDTLFDIMKEAVRVLGLRYESLDFLVETYGSNWDSKGYDKESIILIARYCAFSNIRSMEGLNNTVEDFYKGGYVSGDSIQNYLDCVARNDNTIRQIILATGSTRGVTKQDRDFYMTWSNSWGYADKEILEVAPLAEGRPYAFSYINGILLKKHQKETAPATTRERSAEKLQETFAVEELKAKLREDEEYRDLDNRRRKISLTISRYLANGSEIPLEADKEYKSVTAELRERIVALGYNPDEIL